MTTKARAGVGATLEVDAGSGYTYIANITALGGPELDVEEIEATSLDSVGGYKEYIPGMKDGGTISVTLNFTNDAAQRALRTMNGSIDLAAFRLTLPSSPTAGYTFQGGVTSWTHIVEPNSPMTADVDIKISGAITFSEGGAGAGPASFDSTSITMDSTTVEWDSA